MLTLFHSPKSRSTRVVALIHALGIQDEVDIRPVTITRQDGSGGIDTANPHPEGKVPLLVHDGVEIWESAAIMLYLTDLYPDSGLGVPVGDPQRGRFLSWLMWYGDVMEPVGIFMGVGIDHPAIRSTFRDMNAVTARLSTALDGADWLVAGRHTVADMICASMFHWYPPATPDVPAVRDWVARCADQPFITRANDFDAKLARSMGIVEPDEWQEPKATA